MNYSQITKQAVDFQKSSLYQLVQRRGNDPGSVRFGNGSDNEPVRPGNGRIGQKF